MRKTDPSKLPLACIRRFCKSCVGSAREIENCTGWDCELWDYRFGKYPRSLESWLVDREGRRQAFLAMKEKYGNSATQKQWENAFFDEHSTVFTP